ncbi:hypothetical protein DPEC_G00359260 [Dallia pectoralis]|uniref:Uncharacterized protein n=1 Tax=Dallia pectoralis TaxID=75939 RepID=A0ACC2F0W8_DALPE|nr:hypothetical protein DPEC_G00359260 [Dallia pectoralis]
MLEPYIEAQVMSVLYPQWPVEVLQNSPARQFTTYCRRLQLRTHPRTESLQCRPGYEPQQISSVAAQIKQHYSGGINAECLRPKQTGHHCAAQSLMDVTAQRSQPSMKDNRPGL